MHLLDLSTCFSLCHSKNVFEKAMSAKTLKALIGFEEYVTHDTLGNECLSIYIYKNLWTSPPPPPLFPPPPHNSPLPPPMLLFAKPHARISSKPFIFFFHQSLHTTLLPVLFPHSLSLSHLCINIIQ